MSSIVRDGHTFHGTSINGRGVFVLTEYDGEPYVYAGQINDGYACGLGVLTRCCAKVWAEYGPDGKIHGRHLYLSRATGGLAGYILFEHGVPKERAWVHQTGEIQYNGEFCTPDDPRVPALIARVSSVVAPANAAATEAEEAVEAVAKLPMRLAGLELMVTMLLARDRQARHPPTVAAGVASELLTLPSGLLAMVCDAIVR